jgi:hypothetical protein
MATQEIPPNEWPLLCNRLKSEHNQGLVNVTVNQGGRSRELVQRTLAELSSRPAGQDESILISVKDQWYGYLGHTISHPTRILLMPLDEGSETIVVEAADGSTTIVQFFRAD